MYNWKWAMQGHWRLIITELRMLEHNFRETEENYWWIICVDLLRSIWQTAKNSKIRPYILNNIEFHGKLFKLEKYFKIRKWKNFCLKHFLLKGIFCTLSNIYAKINNYPFNFKKLLNPKVLVSNFYFQNEFWRGE